jgi:hypothetical protein
MSMSEQLLEVMRVRYGDAPGYLLLGQSSMFFVDLNPEVLKEDAVGAKTTGIEAMFDVVKAKVESDSTTRKVVDTEQKKALRELLEAYRNNQDKNILRSLRLEQVFNADHSIQLLERIITYSSISKVDTEDQCIIITQRLQRTPMAEKIFGKSATWQFEVLEDSSSFGTLMKMLRELIPSIAFK